MFGECHAHVMMNGYNFKTAVSMHKEQVNINSIHQVFQEYKKHEVTFIRDGGDKYGVSKAALEIAPEYGITYRTPIFAIHKKGYYGGIVGRGFSDMKEYQALVEAAIKEGAHFIKIMISGIMDFSVAGKLSCSALPESDIKEMIAMAHSYGMSVMAHANGDDAVYPAVKYGVDSIEHGNFISKDTISLMKEQGTIYVPTAVTIANLLKCDRFPKAEVEKILKIAKENISYAFEIGAHLGLGSDAGAYMVDHGQGIVDEYQLFSEILSPLGVTKELLDQRLTTSETILQKKF